MIRDGEGGALLSLKRGDVDGGAGPALYRVHAGGGLQRLELGDTSAPASEVVHIERSDDGLLAATRTGEGDDTTTILSLRDDFGGQKEASMTLHHTRRAFFLGQQQWLVVGAQPSAPTKRVRWAESGHQQWYWDLADGPPLGSVTAPRSARYVVRHRGGYAVAGSYTLPDSGLTRSVVSTYDAEDRYRWSVDQDVIAVNRMAFDDRGRLWLSGYQRGIWALEHPWGKRKLTDDVHATPFMRGIRRLHFYTDNQFAIEDVVDGMLLRYTSSGKLTLTKHYAVGAIGAVHHLAPDQDGVAFVAYIEGRVPEELRSDDHAQLDAPFMGVTLMVHIDDTGDVTWVQPMEGERLVQQFVRVDDGYITLTTDGEGRCELAKWSRPNP